MADPGGGSTPLPVVVNAAAGPARRDAALRVSEALAAAGVNAEVEAVPAAAIHEAVERRCREGSSSIGVAGGDGTLLTAAEVLAGSRVFLAPIPTGSLNHFARRLGMEGTRAAAAAIRRGNTAELPLGVVDDRVFLNTATFGFYAGVVRRRERFRRVLGKWPAAALAFAVAMCRLKMVDLSLVIGGERLERRTALVWVGVGRGSFPLVHQAPGEGSREILEIVLLRPRGIRGSAGLVLRTVKRLRSRSDPAHDPALEVLHARQLLLVTKQRIGATLDGEVLECESPVLIALQDSALRVITGVPEAAAAGSLDARRAGTGISNLH